MTAIATLSGRVIDFLNPDPEQIILDDLAAGLASHTRYSGQVCRPYTVAMHSLLVASLVEPRHTLHALLHDAPEAFGCDLPSPHKEAQRVIARMVGHESTYDVIERNLWKAICRRYDISPELPAEVVEADRTAMVIEAPILQPKGWLHQVWDFAREIEREIGGAHRERLMRILALPLGGRSEWLWWTVDELAKRREA